MTRVLSADELATALADITQWSGGTEGISRTVVAPTFIAGIELVNAVAAAAEAADHHPDIDVRWRSVTFRLSTHSAGGVTERDLSLAREIDELVRQRVH